MAEISWSHSSPFIFKNWKLQFNCMKSQFIRDRIKSYQIVDLCTNPPPLSQHRDKCVLCQLINSAYAFYCASITNCLCVIWKSFSRIWIFYILMFLLRFSPVVTEDFWFLSRLQPPFKNVQIDRDELHPSPMKSKWGQGTYRQLQSESEFLSKETLYICQFWSDFSWSVLWFR